MTGDYRGELASALRAITTYLKHFAFPPEMALVRLDGQYGDATVITQLVLAGVYSVPRGRGYRLLEHPQIQRVLAHPPTASVTRMNTGEVVVLFDGGWLELGEGLPHVRVIVARHPAPPITVAGVPAFLATSKQRATSFERYISLRMPWDEPVLYVNQHLRLLIDSGAVTVAYNDL